MKSAPFILAAFTCLFAQGATAGEHASIHSSFNLCNISCDGPIRCAERHDARDTRLAITTDNGKVTLLLTDRVVAMQLSDRVLHKVERKLKDADDEDDNGLGRVIKTAVLTSVLALLNHSAECDIRDIASADYRSGELILTARNGKRIFGHADIDDENIMRDFSESDARVFVQELRRRMVREL